MSSCCSLLLQCSLVVGLALGQSDAPSPFSHLPFLTVWNAPTSRCRSAFGVDLDLGVFSVVQNQNQSFMGDNITIFYSDKLGRYPRYSQGEPVNGGLPQNASLDEHLKAAAEDVRAGIPDGAFRGLAVVDWESWRPVWKRNWDTKRVYWEGSRALVRSKHPDWSPARVEVAARQEFEAAGRGFMEETLRWAQRERPGGLWGYYGFPNCYNYYSDQGVNYTGECPPIELQRNDELLWLWNVSSALYPDIYLSLDWRGLDTEVLAYAHHRVLEAMRAAAQVTPRMPPVYPYARIVYTYSLDFLSQEHLAYTIGETAALGSAGIVLWGDNTFAKSKGTCEALKSYIDDTLGRYLVNVTTAAALCSRAACSSRGRCQRRNPESKAYLHLDPAHWKVMSEDRPEGGKSYTVLGQLRWKHAMNMKSQFKCICYTGWGGDTCSEPLPT